MLQRRMLLWSIILLVGAFSLFGCGGGDDDAAPAPTGTTTRFAVLDGAQAGVPANPTIGTGILTVNADTGAASGSITIMTATASPIGAAHVHEGATGVNGGVIIPLLGTAGTNTGTWSVPAGTTLTAAQIASFTAGNLYFAVHTSATGEPQSGGFRGQINRTSVTLNATVDGTQAGVPANPQIGTGSMTVNADGTASGSMVITTATASPMGAAHVHRGARGTNGAVAIPLAGAAGVTTGTWSIPTGSTLTADDMNLFIAGNLYFAVHTSATGEPQSGGFRGQIDAP